MFSDDFLVSSSNEEQLTPTPRWCLGCSGCSGCDGCSGCKSSKSK